MKQNKASFTHRNVENLFIVYKSNTWFGTVKLTNNAHPDKYGYNVYGIGFDARSHFSLQNGEWGQNIVTFGIDNSLSLHVVYRKKDISAGTQYPEYVPLGSFFDRNVLNHNRTKIELIWALQCLIYT